MKKYKEEYKKLVLIVFVRAEIDFVFLVYSIGQWCKLSLLVPVVGVEPTRPCELRILSPVRLPFRHTGILNF